MKTGEIYLRMTVHCGNNCISYREIGEEILKKVEKYEKFLFWVAVNHQPLTLRCFDVKDHVNHLCIPKRAVIRVHLKCATVTDSSSSRMVEGSRVNILF
jgi:hypothetical protein